MNRTPFIVVAAVIILAVVTGLVYLSNQGSSGSTTNTSSPSPSDTFNLSSEAVVTYQNGSFSPSSITVASGTTVQFMNQSSTPVWVASNPHPSHTDYPGFDALKEVAPGENYSFTFVKTGTWGYHNHLNPSEGGAVVVK